TRRGPTERRPCSRWARPRALSATTTLRSATTRAKCASCPGSTGPTCAARTLRGVPGVDGDDLRRQAEEIAAANERLAPFRVLRGSECDILPDGTLDLPADVLPWLEGVQGSV